MGHHSFFIFKSPGGFNDTLQPWRRRREGQKDRARRKTDETGAREGQWSREIIGLRWKAGNKTQYWVWVLAESAALFGESGAKHMLKSIVHIRVRRFNTNTGRIENNFESLWMFSLNFCFTKNRKPNQFVHETPEQTRVHRICSVPVRWLCPTTQEQGKSASKQRPAACRFAVVQEEVNISWACCEERPKQKQLLWVKTAFAQPGNKA